jgi:hypothetical protein
MTTIRLMLHLYKFIITLPGTRDMETELWLHNKKTCPVSKWAACKACMLVMDVTQQDAFFKSLFKYHHMFINRLYMLIHWTCSLRKIIWLLPWQRLADVLITWSCFMSQVSSLALFNEGCLHAVLYRNIERCYQVVNTSASCSAGPKFKSWSGDWLSWLRVFVVFLSPTRKSQDNTVN